MLDRHVNGTFIYIYIYIYIYVYIYTSFGPNIKKLTKVGITLLYYSYDILIISYSYPMVSLLIPNMLNA